MLNDPRPIQRSGDFTTEGHRFVRYHAVAMPFRGGLGAAPAWLAAAECNAVPLSMVIDRQAS